MITTIMMMMMTMKGGQLYWRLRRLSNYKIFDKIFNRFVGIFLWCFCCFAVAWFVSFSVLQLFLGINKISLKIANCARGTFRLTMASQSQKSAKEKSSLGNFAYSIGCFVICWFAASLRRLDDLMPANAKKGQRQSERGRELPH